MVDWTQKLVREKPSIIAINDPEIQQLMIILGCESSCDETGLAIYDTNAGLRGHVLHSQIDEHALYGGVVPELASRDHIKRLTPLFNALMAQTGLAAADLDGIAYTQGPGLAGALLTGAQFSRSLAFGLGIPALGIHHMEGHLLAPMLETPAPQFPFVCLLVSGGHTLLVDVTAIGAYKVLGESIDDAAGEAFDKTAKMLGLPYPGGPHLAALAEMGNPKAVSLPRPMLDRPGMDFSFSGLKTAAIVHHRAFVAQWEAKWGLAWESELHSVDADKAAGERKQWLNDLSASFQEAVVDTLIRKSVRALQQTGHGTLVISGGVSANKALRQRVDELCQQHHWQAFYPALEFCTDNGAMIALAGAYRMASGLADAPDSFQIKPRWPVSELGAL